MALERLDLLLLAIETIDLNGSESMFSIVNKLNLQDVLSSKVQIWKLRCNNPIRKSFINNKIKLNEFDALIKLTVEMSKYLYPYIREILSSKDNYNVNPMLWNDFKIRYRDLIAERFNIESIRVKKLIDVNRGQFNYEIVLLNLALCNSEEGYLRLKNTLFNL